MEIAPTDNVATWRSLLPRTAPRKPVYGTRGRDLEIAPTENRAAKASLRHAGSRPGDRSYRESCRESQFTARGVATWRSLLPRIVPRKPVCGTRGRDQEIAPTENRAAKASLRHAGSRSGGRSYREPRRENQFTARGVATWRSLLPRTVPRKPVYGTRGRDLKIAPTENRAAKTSLQHAGSRPGDRSYREPRRESQFAARGVATWRSLLPRIVPRKPVCGTRGRDLEIAPTENRAAKASLRHAGSRSGDRSYRESCRENQFTARGVATWRSLLPRTAPRKPVCGTRGRDLEIAPTENRAAKASLRHAGSRSGDRSYREPRRENQFTARGVATWRSLLLYHFRRAAATLFLIRSRYLTITIRRIAEKSPAWS